jgi:N-acetylglucosamine-6-phosphate deacetylase
MTLYLSGGLIERLAPGRDPGADLLVDGTILPGLIDLQVNGAYGFDFTNDAAGILPVAARLPESGVTAFLPTIITSAFETYPERLRDAAAACREARPPAARALGVHLEGPYLNPLRKGAHPPAYIRPIDVDEVCRWAGHETVRIVTLAPELEHGLEAVQALSGMGIVVSAGHSNATYAEARSAFAGGVRWATHLYNAQSPLQHREPGLMGAILTGGVPCGLIVDGIHSHPAMVDLAYRSKGAGGITLVTDCMAAMGMAPGRYELGHHPVIVTQDSARLEDGTLAGSILRLDQAVRNMMAYTGCTLAEAAGMAAANPARLLGQENLGAIAPGCAADLVVFSPENEVTHTFVAGLLAYQRRAH